MDTSTATRKVTLIVCGKKFCVNRKLLASRSEYFRALLEGQFSESQSENVELFGVVSAEGFALLMDYLAKGRLQEESRVQDIVQAVDLADMFGVEGFVDQVKEILVREWDVMERLDSFLELADKLNIRASVSKTVARKNEDVLRLFDVTNM